MGESEVELVVDAGVEWDDFVAQAVEMGCRGVEMMSGIPGRVGAAPLQNIAAYGQQVCDVIEAVGVIDRQTLEESGLGVDECEFGFRTSRFKRDWRDRFVVTHVRFRLPLASSSPPKPSTYVDVERYFERTGLSPTDLAARRQAVLDIRRSKSMVLDPDDPMTRSVGSFFVNPEVPVELARELTERFKTMGLRVQYLEGKAKAAPRRRVASGSRRPTCCASAASARATGGALSACPNATCWPWSPTTGLRIRRLAGGQLPPATRPRIDGRGAPERSDLRGRVPRFRPRRLPRPVRLPAGERRGARVAGPLSLPAGSTSELSDTSV